MIKTTLTTGGKDWIAQNLGISNCMTETSRAFTYHDDQNNIDISATGGTATMMSRLIDSLVSYITIGGTKYYADALATANGSMPVYPADVQWVMANDSGTAQYCAGVTPPPTECTVGTKRCRDSKTVEQCFEGNPNFWSVIETCGTGYKCSNGSCVPEGTVGDKPVTGPLEVYVGGGISCPAGGPSVTLDTTGAFAYFKADPITYVGVMNILIHNLSNQCFAYFAWEMRMWDGPAGTTCPITAPERQEISRFLGEVSDTKVISVTRTNASENKMIGGSFEIPPTLEGLKTICLSLWGNFSKQALLDELAVAGYAEEIPW